MWYLFYVKKSFFYVFFYDKNRNFGEIIVLIRIP